ncbi:hypothetical protein V1525DRAFT_397882 [Lipomyces kononenkoae]|uniref:Uncharacterized protein n=1 Tax=Lipomyces kononenkoae TaxID=34357 RepID=A0ACC3T7R1_LIPKO
MRDVYSNRRPGYGFLSEPMNNLPTQYLWDHLLRTPDLRRQFFNGTLVIVGRAHQYLKSLQSHGNCKCDGSRYRYVQC